MAKNKDSKKPSFRKSPPDTKAPRTNKLLVGSGKSLFRWRIHPNFIDFNHKQYGWHQLSLRAFFAILVSPLHDYENMQWSDLANRQSCHTWKISDIPRDAQIRISERYSERVNDTLFQIDVNEFDRIVGYRDRSIFYVMWYVPNHIWDPIK